MKKIKVTLSDDAPYTHTYLLEHDVYADSRHVYIIEQRAFNTMIKAQTDGHIIREYSNWDEDFQQKMINEYNPEAHSAIPLMPRITVDKFVDPIAQNLIDKLFKKERKEKVTFMVSFGNGRHRLNLFRHLGAKSLPFQMTKESADTLNEMLEDTVCKIQL